MTRAHTCAATWPAARASSRRHCLSHPRFRPAPARSFGLRCAAARPVALHVRSDSPTKRERKRKNHIRHIVIVPLDVDRIALSHSGSPHCQQHQLAHPLLDAGVRVRHVPGPREVLPDDGRRQDEVHRWTGESLDITATRQVAHPLQVRKARLSSTLSHAPTAHSHTPLVIGRRSLSCGVWVCGGGFAKTRPAVTTLIRAVVNGGETIAPLIGLRAAHTHTLTARWCAG